MFNLTIKLAKNTVDMCELFQETLHNHNGNNNPCDDSLKALEAESCETHHENEGGHKPKKSVLRNWPLMSSIIVYSVFSLHEMAFSEVLVVTSFD